MSSAKVCFAARAEAADERLHFSAADASRRLGIYQVSRADVASAQHDGVSAGQVAAWGIAGGVGQVTKMPGHLLKRQRGTAGHVSLAGSPEWEFAHACRRRRSDIRDSAPAWNPTSPAALATSDAPVNEMPARVTARFDSVIRPAVTW